MERLIVIAASLVLSLTCLGQSFFTQGYSVAAGPFQPTTDLFNNQAHLWS
jgi:hypothetical protein